jgi:hypothetical protein
MFPPYRQGKAQEDQSHFPGVGPTGTKILHAWLDRFTQSQVQGQGDAGEPQTQAAGVHG